jgi:2-hydroxy-6-oxonona-2,4-dienedioate hydrolase
VWTVVGGLPMHARVATELAPVGAPAVVLVHGLVISSRYMIPTAVRLAPDYRVYAPDLPGFGYSAGPSHALDVHALADALVGWLRASGLGRVSLIGNSLGCQVIVDVALRYPEHVERLVLTGPTMDPRGRAALEQARRLLLDVPRERLSLIAPWARDLWSAGVYRTLRTFWYGLTDPIEAKLPRVGVPTLVVRGERDPVVPQAWAAEVARLLPKGRLVVIPGAPHALNYSRSRDLVRVVAPFLRGERFSLADTDLVQQGAFDARPR